MKQLCENCQAKYEFKIPLRICPWCGHKKLSIEWFGPHPKQVEFFERKTDKLYLGGI